MRRIFWHPAWLAAVLPVLFVAGVAVGHQAGQDSQPPTTVVRQVTTTATEQDVIPPITVTVTHRQALATTFPNPDSSSTTSDVDARYGSWYGQFRATGLEMTTDAGGSEIVGQFENVRACSNADVDLDATFYKNGIVIGSGTGAVTSAPEGTPVSLDVIGFPSSTPDRATTTVTDVLCG